MNVIYLRRKTKFIPIVNFINFAISTIKLNTFMFSMSHPWNKRATHFILRVPASHSQKQIVPSAPVEDRYLFEPLHNGENWKTIKEKKSLQEWHSPNNKPIFTIQIASITELENAQSW